MDGNTLHVRSSLGAAANNTQKNLVSILVYRLVPVIVGLYEVQNSVILVSHRGERSSVRAASRFLYNWRGNKDGHDEAL